jgi:hypothetical protein
MEIAVWLGRETGDDLLDSPGVEIGLYDVADEVAPCLGRRWFCGHPKFLLGIGEPSAKFALMSQAYFALG